MRVTTAVKQVGARLYRTGCVQLAAALRREHGLGDKDRVHVHVRVYETTGMEVGEAVITAPITSGGELYIGKCVPGASAGHMVDLVLLD